MHRLSRISRNATKRTPISKINFHCSLKGKTLIISGASRGIGLAIAKRAARDGANIVILAKTDKPHPKLPGTIYTAAKELEAAGGKALPLKCDIRFEEQVKACVEKAVAVFGGIDVVVNNASAIDLAGTHELSMKKYDLMNSVNARGTFLLTKTCLPYLKASSHAHVVSNSPPLFMSEQWFMNHPAYSIAKYGMSLCVLGFAGEFRDFDISVNAVWPATAIATSAVKNYLGGDPMMRRSRKDTIVADAVYAVITTKPGEVTGGFFIDEDLIRATGVTDLSKYKFDPKMADEDLLEDYFIE